MTCLLSFDVEDWFHAHNLRPAVSKADWEHCESRVVANTRKILSLLNKHDTYATFFVLGWVARRHPGLVEEIAGAGHEVASHGCNHRLLYSQSREEVREDLERSVEILRSIVDMPVRGTEPRAFPLPTRRSIYSGTWVFGTIPVRSPSRLTTGTARLIRLRLKHQGPLRPLRTDSWRPGFHR